MRKVVVLPVILALIISTISLVMASKNDSKLPVKSKYKLETAEEFKNYCKEDTKCYKNQLGLYMSKSGVEKTILMINDLAEITQGIYNDCHNISHSLGQEAYNLIGKEALKYHSNSCQWGFGHGVLIQASESLPSTLFVDTFKDFCVIDPEPIGCLHGIGHALGSKKTDAKETQDICYKIGEPIDSAEERRIANKSSAGACVEGWVMQQLGSIPYNTFKSTKEPVEECSGMNSEARYVCNGMSLRNFVIISLDFEEKERRLDLFLDYCKKIKNNMEGYECGRYIAEAADDIYVPDQNFNTESIAKSIDKYCGSKWEDACTTSYTNYQINRNNSDYKPMLGVCKIIRDDLSKYCLEAISHRANKSVDEILSE